MTSHREQKRIALAGVAALKARPGWDPAQRAGGADAAEQLRDLAQTDRTSAAAQESAGCGGCARERLETRDATALCERHLAIAMGLG